MDNRKESNKELKDLEECIKSENSDILVNRNLSHIFLNSINLDLDEMCKVANEIIDNETYKLKNITDHCLLISKYQYSIEIFVNYFLKCNILDKLDIFYNLTKVFSEYIMIDILSDIFMKIKQLIQLFILNVDKEEHIDLIKYYCLIKNYFFRNSIEQFKDKIDILSEIKYLNILIYLKKDNFQEVEVKIFKVYRLITNSNKMNVFFKQKLVAIIFKQFTYHLFVKKEPIGKNQYWRIFCDLSKLLKINIFEYLNRLFCHSVIKKFSKRYFNEIIGFDKSIVLFEDILKTSKISINDNYLSSDGIPSIYSNKKMDNININQQLSITNKSISNFNKYLIKMNIYEIIEAINSLNYLIVNYNKLELLNCFPIISNLFVEILQMTLNTGLNNKLIYILGESNLNGILVNLMMIIIKKYNSILNKSINKEIQWSVVDRNLIISTILILKYWTEVQDCKTNYSKIENLIYKVIFRVFHPIMFLNCLFFEIANINDIDFIIKIVIQYSKSSFQDAENELIEFFFFKEKRNSLTSDNGIEEKYYIFEYDNNINKSIFEYIIDIFLKNSYLNNQLLLEFFDTIFKFRNETIISLVLSILTNKIMNTYNSIILNKINNKDMIGILKIYQIVLSFHFVKAYSLMKKAYEIFQSLYSKLINNNSMIDQELVSSIKIELFNIFHIYCNCRIGIRAYFNEQSDIRVYYEDLPVEREVKNILKIAINELENLTNDINVKVSSLRIIDLLFKSSFGKNLFLQLTDAEQTNYSILSTLKECLNFQDLEIKINILQIIISIFKSIKPSNDEITIKLFFEFLIKDKFNMSTNTEDLSKIYNLVNSEIFKLVNLNINNNEFILLPLAYIKDVLKSSLTKITLFKPNVKKLRFKIEEILPEEFLHRFNRKGKSQIILKNIDFFNSTHFLSRIQKTLFKNVFNQNYFVDIYTYLSLKDIITNKMKPISVDKYANVDLNKDFEELSQDRTLYNMNEYTQMENNLPNGLVLIKSEKEYIETFVKIDKTINTEIIAFEKINNQENRPKKKTIKLAFRKSNIDEVNKDLNFKSSKPNIEINDTNNDLNNETNKLKLNQTFLSDVNNNNNQNKNIDFLSKRPITPVINNLNIKTIPIPKHMPLIQKMNISQESLPTQDYLKSKALPMVNSSHQIHPSLIVPKNNNYNQYPIINNDIYNRNIYQQNYFQSAKPLINSQMRMETNSFNLSNPNMTTQQFNHYQPNHNKEYLINNLISNSTNNDLVTDIKDQEFSDDENDDLRLIKKSRRNNYNVEKSSNPTINFLNKLSKKKD